MTTGCCGETTFDLLATNEELDKEPSETGRVRAEQDEEARESGEFGPEGGTLSDRDFEEAIAS